MNTIGKKKWPAWVKKAVGNGTCMEVKENNGRYYAYHYKSVWNPKNKKSTRTSTYRGAVTPAGVKTPYEASLKGLYEYGHVRFVWNILERNKVLPALRRIYPDDWKVLLAFAMNRLIDPRSIKSVGSWYEKTYLPKLLGITVSPKKIARVLETVGMSWKSQLEFFTTLRANGEKIIYDGSVIFSASKDNPLLETGYNKEHLLLPKANVVMAFSHDRFIPVFFRVVPGSIHEISTIDILLEDLGEDIILVLDKGFTSAETYQKLAKAVTFIVPLKRDSLMIDYGKRLGDFFLYRDRPIKYTSYQHDDFFVYLYEDISLRAEEEKTYYHLLSDGKKVEFKEHWAGKISILSNASLPPKEVYEMWKSRDQIEKSFDTLQNQLDTDRPYVHKEETFRGYLFASFIGLIAYYLVLRALKKAEINDKISVSDALLELSKIYKIEIGEREILSERSKRVRSLIEKLGIEYLITKNRGS